ncbi:hypothetical protein RS030_111795 [Cryptosporidium xiaoi]|uniref:Signal peptide-containing protein n=1 Tax=Cryptosporidium xiaoi TaxID=659607 RepID=A0AAV9Y3H2_9CRYT
MFFNISFILFFVLQSTFLSTSYGNDSSNSYKAVDISPTLRSGALSDKTQMEILSVPRLGIVRLYKKTLFISNSIWDLIIELRENVNKFNLKIGSDSINVLETPEFNELYESLQRLQKKLIQEFEIRIPLLVPGINKHEFDLKTTESWVIFNINKLSITLSKTESYSSLLQKGVISYKKKIKLREKMSEISDRIQYILVWFQVYVEYSNREASLYFVLTEYFNNIELLSLKETVESSVLFCHDTKLILKINHIRKKIEDINPYIPVNIYKSQLENNDSLSILELLKLFNKRTQILKFKFENDLKEHLKNQEVDLTNLEVLEFIIKIYQNINNLNQLIEQLIKQ